VELKIKNFRNDQRKNELKKKPTLIAGFCFLLVAPKKKNLQVLETIYCLLSLSYKIKTKINGRIERLVIVHLR
jgi:hypothetical protein